jgi:hypothetical protein
MYKPAMHKSGEKAKLQLVDSAHASTVTFSPEVECGVQASLRLFAN